MTEAVPRSGLSQVWRWAGIGAMIGLLLYAASILAGITPLAVWEGRGLYFNLGRFCGAAIGGGFVGALAALIWQTARSR